MPVDTTESLMSLRRIAERKSEKHPERQPARHARSHSTRRRAQNRTSARYRTFHVCVAEKKRNHNRRRLIDLVASITTPMRAQEISSIWRITSPTCQDHFRPIILGDSRRPETSQSIWFKSMFWRRCLSSLRPHDKIDIVPATMSANDRDDHQKSAGTDLTCPPARVRRRTH